MDAELRNMVDRVKRGGPDAVKSAISALQASLTPEPTTRGGWARKAIADLAAEGKQAVRMTRSFGCCDVAGGLVRAGEFSVWWRDAEDGRMRRANLNPKKRHAPKPHTEPCSSCGDSPDGPYNAANEASHCSIHGSFLGEHGCETCRST